MSNPFKDFKITSPYGWRTHPITKLRAFHTGIDLVKKHKAPIHAFAAGKVVHAKMGVSGSGFGGYGNVVAIEDANGHLHVYAHLDSCAVRVGHTVKKGQVIGYQGNTGQSTGSHLHYEIRKKAESKPPYGWIADRENNCYNPTVFLTDLAKKEEEAKRIPVSSPTLRFGMRGEEVRRMQSNLASVYFYPEKGAKNNGIDGIFGPKTFDAVKRFQTIHMGPKDVDGIYGPKTHAKLRELISK